jgi:hypothetical protein
MSIGTGLTLRKRGPVGKLADPTDEDEVRHVAGTDQRSGSSDDGRRVTKAERREEARLKREEIQRKMASRRRNRSIGLVLLVLSVVIVVVAVFLTSGGSGTSATDVPTAATVLSQAAKAADTAGCDAVQETTNYANAPGDDPAIDHTHIGTPPVTSAPALSTYATIPPASGPHDPSPLPAGVYDSPPDVYRTIHSLEHGAVIIWYSPDATGKQLDDLIAFYTQPAADPEVGQAKIIIAPYDYPDQGAAGQLPAGVQMAVVSWHRLQTCTAVSLPVAFGFSSQFEVPGYGGQTYKGVAREPDAAI